MTTRRKLLGLLATLFAAPALAFGVRRPVERIGDVYVVDGWVLTEADLRDIGRHAG